jgi:hypothetical protein
MDEKSIVKYLGKKPTLRLTIPYLSSPAEFTPNSTIEMPKDEAERLISENPKGFCLVDPATNENILYAEPEDPVVEPKEPAEKPPEDIVRLRPRKLSRKRNH